MREETADEPRSPSSSRTRRTSATSIVLGLKLEDAAVAAGDGTDALRLAHSDAFDLNGARPDAPRPRRRDNLSCHQARQQNICSHVGASMIGERERA